MQNKMNSDVYKRQAQSCAYQYAEEAIEEERFEFLTEIRCRLVMNILAITNPCLLYTS